MPSYTCHSACAITLANKSSPIWSVLNPSNYTFNSSLSAHYIPSWTQEVKHAFFGLQVSELYTTCPTCNLTAHRTARWSSSGLEVLDGRNRHVRRGDLGGITLRAVGVKVRSRSVKFVEETMCARVSRKRFFFFAELCDV